MPYPSRLRIDFELFSGGFLIFVVVSKRLRLCLGQKSTPMARDECPPHSSEPGYFWLRLDFFAASTVLRQLGSVFPRLLVLGQEPMNRFLQGFAVADKN